MKKREIMIVIVLIAILAVIIISINLIKDQKKYNGFEVEKVVSQGYEGYTTKVYMNNIAEPFYVNTRYHPKDLEDIPYDSKIKEKLNKKKIYITIDPTQNMTGKTTIAALEINNMVEPVYNIEVLSALTKDIGNNMTIMDCNSVTSENAVIWIKLGENNRVYTENNCVIIEGQTQDNLIKGADLLDFVVLGVVK
ncbi:MAG: hypothetical protein PHT54_02905 [Candidatus Nanoarchaeia archaeon]|nr:hypothetical protein [Candidatus Nanoarchaeia archaeon]